MRKVKFNKWIPKEVKEGKQVENTNCWEKNFPNEGLFHCWGSAYEEFESGTGNYTVALVEISGGNVVEVLPSNITFLEY